jgi:hypothetical protein
MPRRDVREIPESDAGRSGPALPLIKLPLIKSDQES